MNNLRNKNINSEEKYFLLPYNITENIKHLKNSNSKIENDIEKDKGKMITERNEIISKNFKYKKKIIFLFIFY